MDYTPSIKRFVVIIDKKEEDIAKGCNNHRECAPLLLAEKKVVFIKHKNYQQRNDYRDTKCRNQQIVINLPSPE